MKKILSFVALSFSVTVFSQSSILVTNMTDSYTVAPNSIINIIANAGVTTTYDFDIKNTSGSTQNYYVKRYDVTLHSGASAYFCFAGTCYPDVTTISSSNTLAAGQSASQLGGSNQILTADIDEAPTTGLSVIKYTFRNTNVPADSVQFTLKYNSATGLKENTSSVSGFDIYPNPSNGATAFKVNATTSMKAKLCLYNSLGAAVSEKNVNLAEGKNKVDLETENLASGVYFVTLNTGATSLTKKLIIK